MKTQVPYKNESVFQNWVEYCDEAGNWWRRKNKGCGIYAFYAERGDKRGYLLVGHLRTSKKSIKAIHEEFSLLPDDCEYNI